MNSFDVTLALKNINSKFVDLLSVTDVNIDEIVDNKLVAADSLAKILLQLLTV